MPKPKKLPLLDGMPEDGGMDMMVNPLKKRKKTKMRMPMMGVKSAKRRVR